jgi:hypothetical protein
VIRTAKRKHPTRCPEYSVQRRASPFVLCARIAPAIELSSYLAAGWAYFAARTPVKSPLRLKPEVTGIQKRVNLSIFLNDVKTNTNYYLWLTDRDL